VTPTLTVTFSPSWYGQTRRRRVVRYSARLADHRGAQWALGHLVVQGLLWIRIASGNALRCDSAQAPCSARSLRPPVPAKASGSGSVAGRKRTVFVIADETCERQHLAMNQTRRVVFVCFSDFQALDLMGPWEVFSLAGGDSGEYVLELVSLGGPPLRSSSGLRFVPTRSIDACPGPIDTLVVTGGPGVDAAAHDERLIAWLRRRSRNVRRVCAVCTGAFVLARAGLLDGRRATTHWGKCSLLKRDYPMIDVDPDPIFVRDGNVYTSAGVTAGIDLALALVEEDLGPSAALAVARTLVLFVRRPGGQSQFSTGLAGQASEQSGIRELQGWIADHLDEDLSVATLAARVHMSPRNFARVFSRSVGVTPAAYIHSVRLERARVLLETTDLRVEELARRCGFGTVYALRRAFAQKLHVSPSDYRVRFGATNVVPMRAGGA
jgi:transcriptional regulator GlxA family with amidase domain